MPEIIVYSRRGCHLCELLLEELEPLIKGRARLIVKDIDTRPAWVEEYGTRVPVVVAGGSEICQYHLDRNAINQWLASISE